MGLSHSIARGVIAGLSGRHAIFHVTRRSDVSAKRASSRSARRVLGTIREEAELLLGLLACIMALALQRSPGDSTTAVWMAVLSVQALPYAAALACGLLYERSAA
jgi:hypothetical protein